MGRLSHRPLPVSVQQVVSEDVDVGVLGRHPSGHGNKVPDVVARRDVPGLDCGVVGRPSPVAYLELAVLVFVQVRERRPGRSFHQGVHVRDVQNGRGGGRPPFGCPGWADDPAQPGFRYELIEHDV